MVDQERAGVSPRLFSPCSAVEAVEEAENILRRVLEGLSSPALSGLSCTPAFLQEKTQSSLDSIDATTANFSLYNNDPSGVVGGASGAVGGACCLAHSYPVMKSNFTWAQLSQSMSCAFCSPLTLNVTS